MQLRIAKQRYERVTNVQFVFDQDSKCNVETSQDVDSDDITVKLHVPKAWQSYLLEFMCEPSEQKVDVQHQQGSQSLEELREERTTKCKKLSHCKRTRSKERAQPDLYKFDGDVDFSNVFQTPPQTRKNPPRNKRRIINDDSCSNNDNELIDGDVSQSSSNHSKHKEQQTRRKRLFRKAKNDVEEEEDDEDAKKDSSTLYNVDKDTTHCMCDYVHYAYANATKDNYVFFDAQGTELKPDDLSSEFIITPQGEVICPNGVNYAMFAFLDDDGNTKYAPGKPISFEFNGDETMINICWLKTQADLEDSSMNEPISFGDILFEEESALPITSFCANLSHLSQTTRDKWMAEYASTLSHYDKMSKKPHLGSYKPPQKMDVCVADLLDLFEFRFIKSEWIWRSTLGNYIWIHFISPAIDFGGKPQLSLVEELLSASAFNKHITDITHRGDCEACCKKHVVENVVVLHSRTVAVGYMCLHRMKYIWDIGHCMRKLRDSVTFSKLNISTMFADMQHLQTKYQEEQEDFKKNVA